MSKQLQFKILKINTNKFETSDYSDIVANKVLLQLKVDYKGIHSNIIEVFTQFKFTQENRNEPILLVSASTIFDIHPDNVKEFILEDGAILLPREFAIHLAGIVVGATRGILAVRTENTKFSQFIIPPTSLHEAISGEVKILLPKESTAN